MNRLRTWLAFLALAVAAWLPQADAMIRPLHPTGGDLSSAVSAPVLPTAEKETYILVYVYDSENPYNGVFCYVQSPLGLEANMVLGWTTPEGEQGSFITSDWLTYNLSSWTPAPPPPPAPVPYQPPVLRAATPARPAPVRVAVLSADRSGLAFMAHQATCGQYELGSPIAENMATLPIEIPAAIMCPELGYVYLAANLQTLTDKNAPVDARALALIGVVLHRSPTKSLPNPYTGIRQASQYLRDLGVPRADRIRILQSFEAQNMVIRQAGPSEFRLRYFSDPAKAGGSYLFETFPASRATLAIKPKWSTMSGFRQYQIRPGATILEGRAAPQGPYLPGGQKQTFVLDWSSDLIAP